MKVWRMKAEWDIGCNEGLWASRELMERDVKSALEACCIEEPLEELLDCGLVSFESEAVTHE